MLLQFHCLWCRRVTLVPMSGVLDRFGPTLVDLAAKARCRRCKGAHAAVLPEHGLDVRRPDYHDRRRQRLVALHNESERLRSFLDERH